MLLKNTCYLYQRVTCFFMAIILMNLKFYIQKLKVYQKKSHLILQEKKYTSMKLKTLMYL